MSNYLPSEIADSIREEIGEIDQISELGGSTQKKASFTIDNKRYFLKFSTDHYPGMFSGEATGLELIGRTKTIRVPKVILVGEQFLVLEWMELDSSHKSQGTSYRKFGTSLAGLHRVTCQLFGLSNDNYIVNLRQDNTQTANWVDFYWGRRIKPQLEIARRRKKVTPEIDDLFDRLYDTLPELIPEKPEASLLHGDLWAGNVGFLESGEPVTYDPAVYCGHREIDLAMTELFGGFPQDFYDAYNTEWPIDPGYQNRRNLYQLYPLMVHWNLFGGGYEGQVFSVIKEYLQ